MFQPTMRKFRVFLLTGWAFAVLWVHFGNIINFHQHRIWGKQLLPVAVTNTRCKDKESASLVKSGNGYKSSDISLHFDFIIPERAVQPLIFSGNRFNINTLPDIPICNMYVFVHGMRGPPVA